MKIDEDIQDYVAAMNPESLGQRVAMEISMQEKRNARRERGEVWPKPVRVPTPERPITAGKIEAFWKAVTYDC